MYFTENNLNFTDLIARHEMLQIAKSMKHYKHSYPKTGYRERRAQETTYAHPYSEQARRLQHRPRQMGSVGIMIRNEKYLLHQKKRIRRFLRTFATQINNHYTKLII